MNKQVIDVYDGMAMPADCARRIEGEMSRAIRQKKGETKFMKNEKNGQKQNVDDQTKFFDTAAGRDPELLLSLIHI